MAALAMPTVMSREHKALVLFDLASYFANITKSCTMVGYFRQQFYEIRRTFQTYRADSLIDRLPAPRNPHPNRVPERVEQAILEHTLAHPCHGLMQVAQELVPRGIQVSSGGVRGVWQRHNLPTKHECLLRLEKTSAER